MQKVSASIISRTAAAEQRHLIWETFAMQPDGGSGLDLKAQLAQERQWRELHVLRVHQLESSLEKAQEECSSIRELYLQLKEDFQFNLAILDERDKELEKYDVITARALRVEHNRYENVLLALKEFDANLEAQCLTLRELMQKTERRVDTVQENVDVLIAQRRWSQKNHRKAMEENEIIQSTMVREMEKQTEKMTQRNLQCVIQELEAEFTLQKQETAATLRREFKQQEHEMILKMDDMCMLMLSRGLKTLSKETEDHRKARLQAKEAFKTFREFCQHMQTQLRCRDQEIEGIIAVKDHRIKELITEVKRLETKLKNTETDKTKQYENVLLALKEFDATVEAQCHCLRELVQKTEKRLDTVQENMAVLTAQLHRSKRDHQKTMGEKDETIQGYKERLRAGLEKERDLQQMRVQVELDWQRHCQDMKAEFHLANEKLIEELTHTRDQDLIPREHEHVASEEICRLKEQNSILRAVVAQMRKDMESFSHPLFQSQAQPQTALPLSVQQPGTLTATSIDSTANTQMTTGPPINPVNPVNPSDGQKVITVAHTESAPCKIEEKQPQFEDVQDARGNPPLLRSRLKQAASCIDRLSREKQQLIEMCNHLRSQIPTAGQQGMISEKPSHKSHK